MKKNLFLRLCLILLVSITAFSCRTDQFHENESYNNSSKFQLTSKRISLDEAKHKAQLIPEINKAEAKFRERSKTNVNGKIIDYGNGITIDTDEVIYMENGPDFHTYTFSVIRDNTPVNAPVENLLLTPNPDGSYRVFHIVLNLTEADKARIAKKEYVDYKNKEQVTELESINFSSLSQKRICIPHYYSYPVSCKEGLHEPGEPCAYAGTSGAAYWGSIVLYDCFGEEPETIMPTPTPGDGGGGGGGECPDCPDNSTPEPCVQIATDPTQVGIIDPNGCIVGMPTDPNLPLPTIDPCRKTKASVTAANNLLKEPNISAEVTSLQNHAANSFTEYGMAIINTGTTTIAQDPYTNNDPTDPGAISISIPSVGNYLASAHSHPEHGAAPPSIKDFYNALKNAKDYPTYQAGYVFAHNGIKYAFVVNDRAKAEAFLKAYPFLSNTTSDGRMFNENSQVGKDFLNILKNYTSGRLPSYTGNSQNDGLESAFAEVLQAYDTGMSIAKTDSNGDLKSLRSTSFNYTIPASGGKQIIGYKAEKCP